MRGVVWVAATGFVIGGSVALVSIPFPAPTVSASTLTVPGRPDSVALAITWARRCTVAKAQLVCPTQWDLRVVRHSKDGWGDEVERRWTGRLKDTVRIDKPRCWTATPMIDTMEISVRAAEVRMTASVVERSNAGTTKLAIRCVAPSLQERVEAAAFVDSFPKGSTRLVVGSWGMRLPKGARDIMLTEQLRATKTAADSLTVRRTFTVLDTARDTVLRRTVGDTTVVLTGYEWSMCWLGRNRYTHRVEIIGGSQTVCEPMRARMDAERSG